MRRAHHDAAAHRPREVPAVTGPEPDPRDWRASCGPDQPDSMQGSTRIGYCTRCKASGREVVWVTREVASGPGPGEWVCLPTCYPKLTGAEAEGGAS